MMPFASMIHSSTNTTRSLEMANDVNMVSLELRALRELGVVSAAKERKCAKYIESNPDEVKEWVDTMGVSAAADLVRDMA